MVVLPKPEKNIKGFRNADFLITRMHMCQVHVRWFLAKSFACSDAKKTSAGAWNEDNFVSLSFAECCECNNNNLFILNAYWLTH